MKLLKFEASWCGPCKMMNPIIEELKQEYPNVEFESLSVEEESELVQKYGVKTVPTFIMLKENKQVGQLVGLVDKEDLIGLLNLKSE